MNKTCLVVGKLLPYTATKLVPQFLTSLIILLDDLWYYRFHDTVYPDEAKFFMENVNVINEIRFMLTKLNGRDGAQQPDQNAQAVYILFTYAM